MQEEKRPPLGGTLQTVRPKFVPLRSSAWSQPKRIRRQEGHQTDRGAQAGQPAGFLKHGSAADALTRSFLWARIWGLRFLAGDILLATATTAGFPLGNRIRTATHPVTARKRAGEKRENLNDRNQRMPHRIGLHLESISIRGSNQGENPFDIRGEGGVERLPSSNCPSIKAAAVCSSRSESMEASRAWRYVCWATRRVKYSTCPLS
jgi:hypothetical protein